MYFFVYKLEHNRECKAHAKPPNTGKRRFLLEGTVHREPQRRIMALPYGAPQSDRGAFRRTGWRAVGRFGGHVAPGTRRNEAGYCDMP
jgi:hypothetical protein